ncbi:MAG TPA: HIT family protein [Gammaproteobacteria bacterium]|nr:HIT family protein [Gammaproteobacteria bacterium]
MDAEQEPAQCVFCGILAGRLPAARVCEGPRCVAFMDLYPLRPCHLLVVPRQHHEFLSELPTAERDAMAAVGTHLARAVRVAFPDVRGFNYVINEGRAAQQTVPHVHLHVLPRRAGDRAALVRDLARRALPPLRRRASAGELERQAAAIRACLGSVTE